MKAEKQEQNVTRRIKWAVTAVVLLFVFFTLVMGKIAVEMGGDAIHLNGGLGADRTIAYREIDDVQLVDPFDRGVRKFGTGSHKLSSGAFQNDLLGSYDCFAWNSCPSCVVVTCRGDGKPAAFNGRTQQETQALYEQLKEKCGLT